MLRVQVLVFTIFQIFSEDIFCGTVGTVSVFKLDYNRS
jgi:hypothetical protein